MNSVQGATRPLESVAPSSRDRDESLVELRRAAVEALARKKRLESRALQAMAHAEQLVDKALLSLEQGNKKLARKILTDRVDTLKSRAAILDELKSTTATASRIERELLLRMQARD